MFTGSKYEATKELSVKEVAKLIRADIKRMVASGELEYGTYSVRSDRNSIDITATLLCPTRIEDEAVIEMDRARGISMPWVTREAYAVKEKLEALHEMYNYDDSDSQCDYFNVRYYGGANVTGPVVVQAESDVEASAHVPMPVRILRLVTKSAQEDMLEKLGC